MARLSTVFLSFSTDRAKCVKVSSSSTYHSWWLVLYCRSPLLAVVFIILSQLMWLPLVTGMVD